MVAFVYDDGAVFDTMANCQLHPNSINYLQNQVNHFHNAMQTWSSQAQHFFQNASSLIYKHFDYNDMIRKTRAAARKLSNLFNYEGIIPITDIGAMQHASYTMMRWIMANPVVRETWLDGRCEGYGDMYSNVNGNTNYAANYDYRRATNGVFIPQQQTMVANTYMEAMREGDRELHVTEQADIAIAWRTAEHFMSLGGDDPTSRSNSRL